MTMTDNNGYTYDAWSDDRFAVVGYKVTAPDGSVSYVYLVPSSDTDADDPNVFLYQGPTGDPCQDAAVVHVLTGVEA